MSDGRASNTALFLCLVFSFLWLFATSLALARVGLAPGSAWLCLIQAGWALVAALPLAARLRAAPTVSTLACLMIWLTPVLLGGQAQLPPLGKASDGEVLVRELSREWCLPYEQRAEWARVATWSALNLEKYPEAPALVAEREARWKRMQDWLQQHPAELRSSWERLYRQGKAPNPRQHSSTELEQNLKQGLDDPTCRFRLQYDAFAADLTPSGWPTTPVPLDEDQKLAANQFVESWLKGHPQWLEKVLRSGAATMGQPGRAAVEPVDEVGQEFRRQSSWFGPAFWLVGALCWWIYRGRRACQRPFDSKQLAGWVASGLRGLLRPDPGAAGRVMTGSLVMFVGLATMFPAVIWAGSSRWARLLAAVVLGGALLAASGLTILDHDD